MTWAPQKAPSHSPSLSFCGLFNTACSTPLAKKERRSSEGLYQPKSCRKPRATSVDSMCVYWGPG